MLRPIMLISLLLVSGCGGHDETPICGGSCPAKLPTAYLAVAATPNANSGAGPTDLYVIPSDAPATAPSHVASYGWIIEMATIRRSDGTPLQQFYTTFHETGGDHLWSLDLTGNTAPVPVQVSNVTFPIVPNAMPAPNYPGSVTFCRSQVIPGTLSDPSSAVLFVSIPDSTRVCDGGPRQVILVHPTDSATTAPTQLTLGSDQILPLYQPTSGQLAGVVAIDSAQNLNFYSDATFAHSTQLLTNVVSMTVWQEPPNLPQVSVSSAPTYSYLVVKTSTSTGAGSVYRIDSTGAISADLYDFQSPTVGSSLVKDDAAYFYDAGVILTISHGSAAQSLYAFSAAPRLGPFLAGIAGQQLVIVSQAEAQSPKLIQTLPISVAGTPTNLASSTQYPGVGISGNDLLVTYEDFSSSQASFSSQILDSSGAILRATSADSLFLSSAPTVLQSSHVSTGADVEMVNLNQPAGNGVALKTASGAIFTLPANTIPTVLPFDATSGVVMGAGQTWIYSTPISLVTPVTIPNASVEIW